MQKKIIFNLDDKKQIKKSFLREGFFEGNSSLSMMNYSYKNVNLDFLV